MNSIQMAWRCVLRKPVKSILLLLTVFIISLSLTAGMASKNASIATTDTARQAVGAGFLLEENEANRHARIEALSRKIGENKEGSLGGYYQKKTIINGTENWQSGTDNSFETLLLEDIRKIAAVPGISAYNITTGTMAVNPVNFKRIEDADVDQNADIQGVSLIGNLDMAMDSNVLSGNLSLIAGRMITGRDSDVCIISEELAAKNSLTIGDNLAFNDCHDRKGSAIYQAEIIGIYQTRQKMAPYMSGDTYRSENVIFTDLRFPEKAEGNKNNPLFAKAYFKVADVDEYASVKEAIKQVDINWERYDLIDNHGNLDTMSSNFHDLQSISNVLIWIIAGASFVILCLIFVFWMNSRVQEAGILLALGMSKIRILRQMLLETLMISLLALVLSYTAAPVLSSFIADYLVEQQIEQAKQQDMADEGKVAKPYEEAEQKVVDVQADITWEIILLDAVGVTLLIAISITTAGIIILRKHPRDILSQMS